MLLPMVLAALSLSGGTLQQTPPDSSLTNAEKRLGVARVWAAVQQHYVNYDRLAIDWDSAFVAATAEAERTETVLDYYRVLAGMVAAIGDGHTRISFPSELRAAELHSFALRTRLIEGRVIVTQVRNDSLYAAGVRPGMEVLEIDGETALAYGRRHVMPYQASSTPQDRLLRTYDYELFRGPADEPVRLLLRTPSGDTLRVEGSRRLPWNRSTPRPLVDFRDLGNGTGYVSLRSFDSSQFFAAFDSIYPRVLETERLVIDARDNGGGSSTYGYYVLSHLVDHPYQGTYWYSRHDVPKMSAGSPGSVYYLQRRHTYDPADAPTYDGPVVLLINEATFSAAEDFTATFDYLERGTIVGSRSGGSSGEPLPVPLPGGGTFWVCTERDTYPDGREFVGIGVIPDVEVSPTVRGVAAGRDEVLEVALEVLGSE